MFPWFRAIVREAGQGEFRNDSPCPVMDWQDMVQHVTPGVTAIPVSPLHAVAFLSRSEGSGTDLRASR